MKRIGVKIIAFVLLLILLLGACSSSRKNELIYRFKESDTAVPFDSLKSMLLSTSGAEMLVVYPDSDVVIIQYDRFTTHHDIIEAQFIKCGYEIVLLKKTKIDEKDQPWKKK